MPFARCRHGAAGGFGARRLHSPCDCLAWLRSAGTRAGPASSSRIWPPWPPVWWPGCVHGSPRSTSQLRSSPAQFGKQVQLPDKRAKPPPPERHSLAQPTRDGQGTRSCLWFCVFNFSSPKNQPRKVETGAHCNLSPWPRVGSRVQVGCGGHRSWAGCSCWGGATSTKTHHKKNINFPSPGDAQCLLQVTQTLDDCREKSQKEENSEKQPNRSRETGKRLLQKSQIQKGKKNNLQA